MIKDDEKFLRQSVVAKEPFMTRAEEYGIPHKRVMYLLYKWTDRGWWDYGVSVTSGWLTDEGKEEFSKKQCDHEWEKDQVANCIKCIKCGVKATIGYPM